MTGPLAGFGAHEQWSIDAVVADYNAKGGVTVDGKQRQVKIVLYDDKSDGNVAAKNVDTLITKDKAVAIIGPIVPTVGNPAALAAERRGVPYIESGNPLEPFLGVKADSGGWKYAFDFFVSGANLGKSTFQWLADYGLDKETNMSGRHRRGQQLRRPRVRRAVDRDAPRSTAGQRSRCRRTR